jgi:hypothetical protein
MSVKGGRKIPKQISELPFNSTKLKTPKQISELPFNSTKLKHFNTRQHSSSISHKQHQRNLTLLYENWELLMNAMLLESYRIEFETTPISIPELCEKYNTTTKELKGYTKWRKDTIAVLDAIDTPMLPAKTIEAGLVVEDTEEDTAYLDNMKRDIKEAKKLALAHAKEQLSGVNAKFLEVKEFKDLVSVIDTLDRSLDKKRDDDKGNSTTVIIQNIMNSFKDDC